MNDLRKQRWSQKSATKIKRFPKSLTGEPAFIPLYNKSPVATGGRHLNKNCWETKPLPKENNEAPLLMKYWHLQTGKALQPSQTASKPASQIWYLKKIFLGAVPVL